MYPSLVAKASSVLRCDIYPFMENNRKYTLLMNRYIYCKGDFHEDVQKMSIFMLLMFLGVPATALVTKLVEARQAKHHERGQKDSDDLWEKSLW